MSSHSLSDEDLWDDMSPAPTPFARNSSQGSNGSQPGISPVRRRNMYKPSMVSSSSAAKETFPRRPPTRGKSEPLHAMVFDRSRQADHNKTIPSNMLSLSSSIHQRRRRPSGASRSQIGDVPPMLAPERNISSDWGNRSMDLGRPSMDWGHRSADWGHLSADWSPSSNASALPTFQRPKSNSFDSEKRPTKFFSTSTAKSICRKGPKGLHARMKSLGPIFLVLVGVATVCFFGYEYRELQEAHQVLTKSYQEHSLLLNERKKEERQSKCLEHWNSNVAPHARVKPNSGNSRDEDSGPEGLRLRQEARHFRSIIQENARDQLHETFPSSLQGNLNVEMHLEAMPSPIVFSVSQEDVPYTVWTWLDQVHRGHWTHSSLTHVGNDDFIEIVTPLTAPDESPLDTRIRSKQLEFAEKYSRINESFVLGIRNPDENSDHGLILTIHISKGSCGKDENEICIGKLTKGEDSMQVLMNLKHPMIVRGMNVR